MDFMHWINNDNSQQFDESKKLVNKLVLMLYDSCPNSFQSVASKLEKQWSKTAKFEIENVLNSTDNVRRFLACTFVCYFSRNATKHICKASNYRGLKSDMVSVRGLVVVFSFFCLYLFYFQQNKNHICFFIYAFLSFKLGCHLQRVKPKGINLVLMSYLGVNGLNHMFACIRVFVLFFFGFFVGFFCCI